MFSRSASVRRVLGRRSMSFDTMFANKNGIAEKRAKFYSNPAVGAENPTYLKEGGKDKAIVGSLFGALAIGGAGLLFGTVNMLFQINKVK